MVAVDELSHRIFTNLVSTNTIDVCYSFSYSDHCSRVTPTVVSCTSHSSSCRVYSLTAMQLPHLRTRSTVSLGLYVYSRYMGLMRQGVRLVSFEMVSQGVCLRMVVRMPCRYAY
jgi:hypothetical protein